MTKKYISAINKNEDVEEGGITLLKRDDGSYAVPGGGYVTNRAYALQIAKRLAFENQNAISPIKSMSESQVHRIKGLAKETAVMSA